MASVFPLAHEDFPFAVELIGSGRLRVAPIFQGHFALDEAQEAFDACHGRAVGAIKVTIDVLRRKGDPPADD